MFYQLFSDAIKHRTKSILIIVSSNEILQEFCIENQRLKKLVLSKSKE